MSEENLMGSLGAKHGTDKIAYHAYHEIFPQYIEKFYDSDAAMLEIGMAHGASLNMWLELFPNMHIYGMDRGDPVGSVDRTTIIQGDQSSQDDLNKLRDSIVHPLFFINDDGSHIPEHQLLTFNTLFPTLVDGGVYIIEDVETSYWTKNDCYGYPTRYGVGHEKSIIEIFKTAMEIDQRWVIEHASDRQQYIDQSQSLNVFFRPDAEIKYLHAIHYMAWRNGLKTMYYCRSEKIGKADKVSRKIERQIINELDMEALASGDECLACEG